MYNEYFGFARAPFALTPDPAFLYPSRQHAMALTLLEYGLESRASFALLTGDVGTGKTTLVRHLVQHMGSEIAVGVITNTHASFLSIHPWISTAFGLPTDGKTDIALYEDQVAFLAARQLSGQRAILIVDEAQNLTAPLLEQLRLLSNVNESGELVLQIILVGQPELRETLRRQDLRQFAQRISADYHLRPFTEVETGEYIRHRLTVAGGDASRFDESAMAAVDRHTGGVPRLVNRLCDMALVYAYAMRQPVVDAAVVDEVMEDRSHVGALPLQGGS